MGKIKKTRVRSSKNEKLQHKSGLIDSLLAGNQLKKSTTNSTPEKHDDNIDDLVDHKLSKKILKSARSQQEELEDIIENNEESEPPTKLSKIKLGTGTESDEDEEWPPLGAEPPHSSKHQVRFDEEIKVDKNDEEALNAFMNPNPPARKTLADLITGKISAKQDEISSMISDTEEVVAKIDPRIRAVYNGVKVILRNYRTGKLPKAFKVIPHLKNWEEILYLTQPDDWSAAAVYQAARLFTSNMNANMAQRFNYLVLLPRVRDDISYYKRLNFHLFSALKKTLFKPAAFFKGILLPLCEEGTCTLREATIIGSVMTKFSIPVLHSSAAMLKIAEMRYNGANSIFLRILIAKKYALPFRVIDALVHHFLSFRREDRTLPVLWHQSLLSFVEIYRADISSEQKEELLALLRSQPHEKITPIIRRLLQGAECRDVEMEETIHPHQTVGFDMEQ